MQNKAKTNKEKRPLKTEPKLNVELNEEQKEVARLFYEYDVNFVLGDFGSGKTLVASYIALVAFRKKLFDKIIITRPILKNNLAALPGTADEKMQPYIYPIIQNLEMCQGKEITGKMRADGVLEILPIEVCKGVTAVNSVVIVDEFEDLDYQDFRAILTRTGKDSKIIFCGSSQQIDKQVGKNSCFYKIEKLKDSGLVGWSELKANHRNDALLDIIRYIEES